MSSVPQKIGRFEILDELGSGGMACVYRAFDPEIYRTLAIKVLHQQHAADPEYRFRFLREAKAAGGLSHRNIVTIYDVGEEEEYPYIAMELVEGKSLEEVMSSGRAMPVKDAVRIGIQLAEALDYAHARGIVHRDIKPGNVICIGESGGIKITDFGIAHLEGGVGSEKTQLGSVLGTPQYMSPEQVNGQTIDGRSDLFAVGVMLYQMISGACPFTGDTLPLLMMNIVNEEPVQLGKRTAAITPALGKTIDRLLQKDPDKRFQTGSELAGALRSVLSDLWDREQRAEKPRIIPIRVKWTLIMAAIVSVTMVVGLVVVHGRQVDAMTRLAVDYGQSMTRFIAMESAEPILIQDWVAIETFVNETRRNQELTELTIVDHESVVRGSSDPATLGQPYRGGEISEPLYAVDGMRVYRRELETGQFAFIFDTPILFQNREIGRVHVGMPTSTLDAVGDLTILMMSVLMAVTVATVVVVGYGLGQRISRPVRILSRALLEARQRHFDHRIDEQRNDEFGLLYKAFDDMAEALEKHADQSPVVAPESLPLVDAVSERLPSDEGISERLSGMVPNDADVEADTEQAVTSPDDETSPEEARQEADNARTPTIA